MDIETEMMIRKLGLGSCEFEDPRSARAADAASARTVRKLKASARRWKEAACAARAECRALRRRLARLERRRPALRGVNKGIEETL